LTPVSDWGTPLAPGWHESRILRSSTNSSTASSSTSPHPPCVQERWIRSSRRRWGHQEHLRHAPADADGALQLTHVRPRVREVTRHPESGRRQR
jgi:hypothetical protein